MPVLLDNAAWCAGSFKRTHRRDLDDVFGIVVDQFQPIFRDVCGREDVILGKLGDKGKLKIVLANAFLLLRGDGALDGDAFGPLDDLGNNGAA